jgi:hypothetical protein
VLRLDRRLGGLARQLSVAYTRYADDLAFSTDEPRVLGSLRHRVAQIVSDEGFRLNPAKTRLMRAAGRQTVTGVVVNRTLGLSRPERRRLRAALHQLPRLPAADRDREAARLKGKLAYVAMLNPEQAARLAGP